MMPKQKLSAEVVLESNNTSQNCLHNSLNVVVDSELPGEDSWVVVKQQKITVLIPPLRTSEQCGVPDLDQSQGQKQKPPDVCAVERNADAMSLSPKSDSQSGRKDCRPPVKAVADPGMGRMDTLRVQNFEVQDNVSRPFCQKKSGLLMKCYDQKPSRAFGQSRVNLLGCTTILNRRMRASNLEIKIVRAGGWRRWLSSLGLEQFERIFRRESVNKFQLANLSMGKLKDMGYHAVGPRRKLIHAIECLC